MHGQETSNLVCALPYREDVHVKHSDTYQDTFQMLHSLGPVISKMHEVNTNMNVDKYW